MERLDKIIAARTAYSRNDARILCRQGRVEVNGDVVRDHKTKISPAAELRIDDEAIVDVPPFVKFHKPLGVISSMDDDWDRESLADMLPEAWVGKLHPVGRLDADSTGLLLFSTDGRVTQKLLHPKHEVDREYLATVENAVDEPTLRQALADGVETAEGIVQADLVSVAGQVLRVRVTEGKYRMVRRMLNNAGHPVLGLHRIRYGRLELGKLEVGQFEEVAGEELVWLEGLRG